MKLHIFTLTDIGRYSKSIIDKGLEVTPSQLQSEASREGYRMPIRLARQFRAMINTVDSVKAQYTLYSISSISAVTSASMVSGVTTASFEVMAHEFTHQNEAVTYARMVEMVEENDNVPFVIMKEYRQAED